MKKIILVLVLLFSFNMCVNAKDIVTKPTGIVTTKRHGGVERTSNLNYIYADDKISYCIEPGVILGSGNYVYSENFSTVGINDSFKKKLELIVYYGYEYKGHESLEYYMATQQIIWEQLGSSYVVFRKDGEVIDVRSKIDEIYKLVMNHDVYPSFVMPEIENKSYDVFAGEDLVIEDSNNKIKDYITDNKNIKIEGNKIIFNSSEVNENKINFTNKVKAGTSLIYYNPNKQDVATFTLSNGNEKNFSININVKEKTSSLTITKKDSETKELLEGSIFELYLDDNLVDRKTTNKEGNVIFDNIKFGKYILKEVQAPKGYILLEDEIKINIDEQTENYTVENTKYIMPITSDIDSIYYKSSYIIFTIGLLINCVYKKIY